MYLGRMVKKTSPPSGSMRLKRLEAMGPRYLRENDPEFSLLVWTSWRISKGGNVVLTSTDCEDTGAPLKEQLKRRSSIRRLLAGSMLKSVKVTSPYYDLTILFSNGYQLDILCHRGNMKPSTDPSYTPILSNWDIFVPGDFVVKA